VFIALWRPIRFSEAGARSGPVQRTNRCSEIDHFETVLPCACLALGQSLSGHIMAAEPHGSPIYLREFPQHLLANDLYHLPGKRSAVQLLDGDRAPKPQFLILKEILAFSDENGACFNTQVKNITSSNKPLLVHYIKIYTLQTRGNFNRIVICTRRSWANYARPHPQAIRFAAHGKWLRCIQSHDQGGMQI
jgi:hypothetical protein